MNPTRALPRHRKRLPVTLGKRLPAFTADVSAGGFCAEMPAVFLPGSVVDGSLTLAGQEVPFSGVVTWAQPGHPATSTRSRFGVCFTHVAGELSAYFQKAEPKRPV